MGAGAMAGIRGVTVYWRPHHEVHPELPRELDFIAFDGETEKSIGRVCLEKQSTNAGRWRWSMFAHSHSGRIPFATHGHEDSRGDADWRVVRFKRRATQRGGSARCGSRLRRHPKTGLASSFMRPTLTSCLLRPFRPTSERAYGSGGVRRCGRPIGCVSPSPPGSL